MKTTKIIFPLSAFLAISFMAGCKASTSHPVEVTVVTTAAATATPTATPGGLFSGGDGTIGTPYLISTLADIELINTKFTNDYDNFKNKYYKQTANIDFASTVVNYLPIGPLDNQPNMADIMAVLGTVPTTKPFIGNYDGDNFKIQNMKFTGSSVAYTGFFRAVGSGGVVKNLVFENPTFLITGALAGTVTPYSVGQIDHVTVTGLTVTTSQMFFFGGLTGIQMGGVGISYSSVAGTFTGSTVNVCAPGCTENTADVGTIGGIVSWFGGFSAGSTPILSHVSNSMNITAGGEAAGIVSAAFGQIAVEYASNSGTIITHERAAGIANSTLPGEVGGMNGLNKPAFSHISNTGSVTVTGATGFWPLAAGLVNLGGMVLTDSYNTGTVTHSHDSVGGGVLASLVNIPFLYLDMQRSYSTGDLVQIGATNQPNIGGLLGQISDSGFTMIMKDNYISGNITKDNSNIFPGFLVGTIYQPHTGDIIDIERCYSTGTIAGVGPGYGGVLIYNFDLMAGQNPTITMQNLFYGSDPYTGSSWANISNMSDYVTAGGTDFSANGTGLSDADMHIQGSFTNFDFATIWNAPDGTHFPTLR